MKWIQVLKQLPLRVRLSLTVMNVFVLTGLLAPYIANDKPIYLEIGTQSWWPIWEETKTVTDLNGNTISCDYHSLQTLPGIKAVWPPVKFAPGKADITGQSYPPPGSENEGRTHFLGANNIGEDTLAGVVHGARISLQVGFASATILLFIGLLFGVVSGYLGNDMLRLNLLQIILTITTVPLAWFYGFQIRSYVLIEAIRNNFLQFFGQLVLSVLLFSAIVLIAIYINQRFFGKLKLRRYTIPLDNIIGRFMEFFTSLPRLILLVSVAAVAQPSMYTIILIIGFTGWVSVARYTRAEILKLKHSDFLSNCRIMGMTHLRVVVYHLIPNAMGPALVSFTFAVAGAILAEAALSYLNIGIPQGVVTWGKLLAEAKYNFDAWWLIWVPGALIFSVLLSLNTLGEYFRKRVNPALQES